MRKFGANDLFKITKVSNSHLHIEFEGSLDSNEMKHAMDDFIGKATGIDNGTMLYEIGEFRFPSLMAIGVKLSKLPALFPLIGKFKRAAILTNKKWLRKVSELMGKLVPGLQIKAFNTDNKPAAEAWLTSP